MHISDGHVSSLIDDHGAYSLLHLKRRGFVSGHELVRYHGRSHEYPSNMRDLFSVISVLTLMLRSGRRCDRGHV
jgi:hypothetical protein